MHPLEVREQARALRASGMTIKAIAAALCIPVGTLHPWIRDLPGPPRDLWRPPARLTKGALHDRKLAEIAECDRWGQARMTGLSPDAFLAAGVALYAGEGSKTDGDLKLVNTNPAIIRFYLRWLREHFEIDEARLRAYLYLHEGLDLDAAVSFWVELTNIPADQFGKPYRAVPDATRRSAKHVMGCLAVSYGSSRMHRQVMGLCRGLLSSGEFDPA
ncbi:MAG TPA: hypothetical protein VNB94_03230 [Mycobacteriales bacterium]|nr:hypothetical protein [Mycobacteriales bacterium]